VLEALWWFWRKIEARGKDKTRAVYELSGESARVKELQGDSPPTSELSAERNVSELEVNKISGVDNGKRDCNSRYA